MRRLPCASMWPVPYIRQGQELVATRRSMALLWCTATASDTIDTSIADSASVRSSQRRPVAVCDVRSFVLRPHAAPSAWQSLVNPQSRRNHGPLWTAAREDRDARAEQRGVIERSCVDREAVVRADDSSEHQSAAHRTGIADRVPTAGRLAGELPRCAAEA